eukprot:Colp12_sorted_trinity150504_noHs@17536
MDVEPLYLYDYIHLDTQIVDIRSKELYESNHIINAVNFPLTVGSAISDTNVCNSVLENLLHEIGLQITLAEFASYKKIFMYGHSLANDEHEDKWISVLKETFDAHAKGATVHVVSGGFEAFEKKYPFYLRNGGYVRELCPTYPSEVDEDFMFLGNYSHASSPVVKDNLRVTHIVDASNVPNNGAFDGQGVAYLYIREEDDDFADLSQHFERFYEFVEGARRTPNARVLVHCKAGVSRSPTFVVYWIMRSRRLPLNVAYDLVVSRRFCTCPNRGGSLP